jgi:hypothetical protein
MREQLPKIVPRIIIRAVTNTMVDPKLFVVDSKLFVLDLDPNFPGILVLDQTLHIYTSPKKPILKPFS